MVCVQLFEDLLALGRSAKLVDGIKRHLLVAHTGNKAHGTKARRGDGTFGALLPGEVASIETGFAVARGLIASVEIGAECKILNKAMIKQIDRVMKDLREQVKDFQRALGSNPISIAVVGVNHAFQTTSYEGSRAWPTGVLEAVDPVTGMKTRSFHAHPVEEAPEAIRRLNESVRPFYDEMIVLRYIATNVPPFAFSWVDETSTRRDYAAALSRISTAYQSRF